MNCSKIGMHGALAAPYALTDLCFGKPCEGVHLEQSQ